MASSILPCYFSRMKTAKTAILSLSLILIFLSFPLSETKANQATNYCLDPSTWAEYEELLQKHPGDQSIRALYALRIGLCILVERQELTVDQGTKIFERYREETIQRKTMESVRENPETKI